MTIFNGLGKCLVDACWLAAGKQPKLKVICPKTIKYLHLPKPLINGRRQTFSFAFLPLTAPRVSYEKHRLVRTTQGEKYEVDYMYGECEDVMAVFPFFRSCYQKQLQPVSS